MESNVSFFGGEVYEDDEWQTVTTRLPCSAEVVAAPEGCSVDPTTLGYPDAWALTRDHDPAHLWLCQALGFISSPTLERQAHGPGFLVSDDLVAYEEAAVHALLAFRNAALKEGWDDRT